MPGIPNLLPIRPSRKRLLTCDVCGVTQYEQRGCQIEGVMPRMYLYVVHAIVLCSHCIWGGDPERN